MREKVKRWNEIVGFDVHVCGGRGGKKEGEGGRTARLDGSLQNCDRESVEKGRSNNE